MSTNHIIKKNGYLDYYKEKNIIPVNQRTDTSIVFKQHFNRRIYLYRCLGLVPAFIKDKSVVEFGPGPGDNAVITDSFKPAEYLLVDGNPASVQTVKAKIEDGKLNSERCSVVEADFHTYSSDEKYDLVLCEGCIHPQPNPKKLIKHLGGFCAPGGLLITSTETAISTLADVCRMLFAPAISKKTEDFHAQVDIAVEIFDKHLASLGVGSSRRPTEDWVLDGIFFPWAEKDEHISIPDVINALQEDFQFYGSSPKYLQDSRWFKSVYEDDTGLNKLALEQYDRFVLGLLDCRVTSENLLKIDNQRVADIEGLCKQAHSYYRIINGEESYDKLDEFLSTLQNVVAILPNEMLVTKNSILDFVRGMPHIAEGNLDYSFGEFVDWWGRGEQYVSLIRNDVERF